MAEFILLLIIPFVSSMFIGTHCIERPLIKNQELVTNYSYKLLSSVPKNVSLETTVLDLSHNNIKNLETTDLNYLLYLKVLNISYNLLTELNKNIFDSNNHLEHLDLSYNQLKNVSCTFPDNLRYLDISYNHFRTLSVTRGLGNLVKLEYLGFGVEQFLHSDFEAISQLKLQRVFINLNNLSDYQNGSLLMLNTKYLHLESLLMKKDIFNLLFDAVNVSESLELSKIDNVVYGITSNILRIAKNSRVTDLTMYDFSLPWNILTFILQVIWHSPVEKFHLSEFTLVGFINRVQFDYSNSSMKELYLNNIQSKVFLFNQTILYRLFSEMNIENLTVNSANFLFMECPLKPSSFQYLDFTSNAMTDDVFQNCATLTKLRTFIMVDNKLQALVKVSSMTSKMIALQHLDVSRNQLHYNEETCSWSQSITKLNLAFCSLTNSVFKCLPKNIRWLDLSKNDIAFIPLNIAYFEKLEYLNLAYNRFFDMPDCTLLPRLNVLHIEYNQIPYPSTDSIHKCKNVSRINMGNNPFHCFCEIRTFIKTVRKSPERMNSWPENYVCELPDNVKGVMLADFYLPEIYCNIYILVPVIVVPIILGLALLFIVCKYCDVPWYLKMIWQWTRTKHRTRKSQSGDWELRRDFDFHAFVSYSEHDASWVKHTMLPSIENTDNSIRICQHERNFLPGKPIVENIINCIEKSYKSIFVLSPHFVQSEWCHYELYFAHQQLFTEKKDNLILILLEPIPQYIIPSRYSRLKALMAKRTYLEWPKEKSKHGLFWANVKAAISINLSDLHHEEPHSETQVLLHDQENIHSSEST
ncbi:PREDICTED: toll-like receptor 6 [Nanorana parkeri]|uniref:toll-like receptor 6 n=1 Tax=Nanorana parkeri TaxID=125878 RepID=UPI000854DA03|nr:PREDICTED: toll-like receptor 6 [Nanorana parkeri]